MGSPCAIGVGRLTIDRRGNRVHPPRSMEFASHGSGAWFLARRPSTDGMDAFLIVEASVCGNAGCPCHDVLLDGRMLVARADLEIDGDVSVEQIAASGGSVGRMFAARVNGHTGEITLDGDGALDASALDAVAWLRSDLTPAVVEKAAAWADDRRRERDLVREIWRDADWSQWSPGQMVGWDEAFAGPWADAYEVAGQWYDVFELYCVNRSCACDRVRIEVMHSLDASHPVIVGTFEVDRWRFERPIDLRAAEDMRERVIEVWKLARTRHDYQARFRERQEAMHGVGAWLDEHVAGRTPVRAAPRVGRNDRCPCGSGRKFKKCCGR